MRALLRFVIAVQLVAGVALAVTVEEDDTPSEAAAPTSTTAPTATTKAPVPTAPPTSAAAAGPRPTTTTQPAGPILKPPAPGKYPYRARYTDVEGSSERTGERHFGKHTGVDGGTQQRVVEFEDETTWSAVYSWRADGAHLQRFGAFGDGLSCVLEPDLLLYPSPLTAGWEWSFAGACNDAEGNPKTTQKFEGTSRVARTERVTVANRQVAVHVIETRGRMPAGDAAAEFHSLDWFSADLGLSVREETTYRYEGMEERETIELLALDPQPEE